MWNDVDDWGWKAGFEFPPEFAAEQARMIATCRETYRPLFTNYRIAPSANRALREAVAAAREQGAAVGFVFLPESRMFQSWYTPEAERQASEHLAAMCRDLAIPLINARDWMADDRFVDGFHLTRRARPSSRASSARPSRPPSRRHADDSGATRARAMVEPANAGAPSRPFGAAPCPCGVGYWVFRHAGRDDRRERGPGDREARMARPGVRPPDHSAATASGRGAGPAVRAPSRYVADAERLRPRRHGVSG